MRILGLDYGDRTIGVAVSDPLGMYAHEVEVIRRDDEKSLKKSIERLSGLIERYEAEAIVLGFPKNMDNTEGERCRKTLDFKAKLERNFKKIPVYLWDERLTTAEAERCIRSLSVQKRGQVVDKVAAAFILQGYLDYKRKGGEGMSDINEFEELYDDEDAYEIITMTDEDGVDTDYAVLDCVEDGGATYLLIVEADCADDEEADAMIIKEISAEGDDVVYESLDNEEELERIAGLFSSDEFEIEGVEDEETE